MSKFKVGDRVLIASESNIVVKPIKSIDGSFYSFNDEDWYAESELQPEPISQKEIVLQMKKGLEDALQMLNQTKQYREANNLTVGNVFLEIVIEECQELVAKAGKYYET